MGHRAIGKRLDKRGGAGQRAPLVGMNGQSLEEPACGASKTRTHPGDMAVTRRPVVPPRELLSGTPQGQSAAGRGCISGNVAIRIGQIASPNATHQQEKKVPAGRSPWSFLFSRASLLTVGCPGLANRFSAALRPGKAFPQAKRPQWSHVVCLGQQRPSTTEARNFAGQTGEISAM